MTKERILMIIMPVLLLILAVIGLINANTIESDSIKFKNEYEKLNDKYYKVTIDKSNKVKYSSYNDIFDAIKSDKAIIYLGTPKDDNSRFAINTLLKLLKEKNIDLDVNYLDISNDRDSFTIIDDKLEYELDSEGKEIKGTKNYKKLVKELDEFLTEETLKLDGKKYKTGTKTIHLPAIIFVNNKKVLDVVYSSVDLNEEDLYDIYEGYILTMYTENCNKEVAC